MEFKTSFLFPIRRTSFSKTSMMVLLFKSIRLELSSLVFALRSVKLTSVAVLLTPLAVDVTVSWASPLLLLLGESIVAGGVVDPANVLSFEVADNEILLRRLGGARFECFRGVA